MFYSMPEIGVDVSVKSLEKLGFVAIHTMPDRDISVFPHQEEKYFNIPRGQTLGMIPTKLFILDNLSSVTLENSAGEIIQTGGGIEVLSMANISLNANNITINAMERIQLGLLDSTSGVDMSAKEINIYSEKTKVESQGQKRQSSKNKDYSGASQIDAQVMAKLVGSTPSKISAGN